MASSLDKLPITRRSFLRQKLGFTLANLAIFQTSHLEWCFGHDSFGRRHVFDLCYCFGKAVCFNCVVIRYSFPHDYGDLHHCCSPRSLIFCSIQLSISSSIHPVARRPSFIDFGKVRLLIARYIDVRDSPVRLETALMRSMFMSHLVY